MKIARVATAVACGVAGVVAAAAFAQTFPSKPVRIVTSDAGGGTGSRRRGCFWGGDRARPPSSRHGTLLRIALALFGGASVIATTVFAQTYPSKPVRIVTSDAGGGSDIVARAMVPALSASLGQPVIVDNRAGGVIAGDFVAKSPPDGHTLIYYGNTLWLLPLMRDNVPYDTVKDFAPISLAVTAPNILVVHPSLPVKSVKDLIALARTKPGALNYGSAAAGTSNHLAAELFKAMAKVNIVRIPYKGMGAVMNDVIAGQVQLVFATTTAGAPHVKSGRLRALGVSSAQPSAAFPELPTIASAGLPGYESALNAGVLAPARASDAIIGRLNREIVRALSGGDLKDKFAAIGVEVVASSADQFAAKIKSEIASMGKVIRDAGIRAE